MNATTINLFRWLIAHLRSISLIRLIWLVLGLGVGATLVQADGPNRIGLVVAYEDTVVTRCIEFSEDKLNGYEVLERSGLDLKIDASSGVGSAICRIDGQGCNYPAEDCFCECQGMTCIFWSYWHLKGSAWEFSALGASNYEVNPGDVEGWVWGEGVVGSSGTEPPAVEFDEICMAPPTATPTPTATHTPRPTATPTATHTHTPQPTATSEPTDTPEPEPTPVIHNFSADRLSINAGESVTLRWDLSDAEAAYLRYDGNEVGVIAPGSQSVAPTTTTVYQLVAENDGGEAIQEITITVNAAPPTATPIPTTAPAKAQPVAQVAPTQTPLPTTTPSSIPAAAAMTAPSPTATSTPLPTTPIPEETIHPTATPPSTATPEAIALAPTAGEVETLPPLNRHFTAEVETEQSFGSRLSALLLYGGVAGIVLLFLVGPVLLLGAGWVAWWLRKER